jgi:TonB family protein
MLTSTGGGAPSASDQMVREGANGEFISRHYPPGALKRGEQGRVAFRLTVETDGSIGECDVTESSGFASLDRETCEIMVRHARTKPVRNADGRTIRTTSPGHIIWKLPASTTRVASVSASTMEKPDKLICKRVQTTGSLIAKTRQCLSKRQWLQAEQEARDAAERIQGRGGCAETCSRN